MNLHRILIILIASEYKEQREEKEKILRNTEI